MDSRFEADGPPEKSVRRRVDAVDRVDATRLPRYRTPTASTESTSSTHRHRLIQHPYQIQAFSGRSVIGLVFTGNVQEFQEPILVFPAQSNLHQRTRDHPDHPIQEPVPAKLQHNQ